MNKQFKLLTESLYFNEYIDLLLMEFEEQKSLDQTLLEISADWEIVDPDETRYNLMGKGKPTSIDKIKPNININIGKDGSVSPNDVKDINYNIGSKAKGSTGNSMLLNVIIGAAIPVVLFALYKLYKMWRSKAGNVKAKQKVMNKLSYAKTSIKKKVKSKAKQEKLLKKVDVIKDKVKKFK